MFGTVKGGHLTHCASTMAHPSSDSPTEWMRSNTTSYRICKVAFCEWRRREGGTEIEGKGERYKGKGWTG